MLLFLLILHSICEVIHANGILTLHFDSVGLDLPDIDCVHPFGTPFHNHIERIRNDQDCEVYIRVCPVANSKSKCAKTDNFPFMQSFTGDITFTLSDKAKRSGVVIQFRSPDILLDTFLTQNQQYVINEVLIGKDITNVTLKSPSFRGIIRGTIDCREGYEKTKYFCERDPKPFDLVQVGKVVDSGNGSAVTEGPSADAFPVESIYPREVLNQQRRTIYCETTDCGGSIIFAILGFSLFMLGLSLTVCICMAKRSRDPNRRLHESSTTVPSFRSRASIRSSLRDSPV